MNELQTTAALLERDGPKIVTVGLVNRSGELLCGLRRDNGLWTNPGGHMDPGETPREGAAREVFEETGLRIKDLQFITGEHFIGQRSGKPLTVFAFMGTAFGDYALTENDPDAEISEWRWVNVHPSRPELAAKNRHSGPGDLILKHLRLF